ncbi:MAG: glutamate--tRNA ligase [Candidatus Magnetobacterium sp. LHC-1]|uniref:Glutamate--tRNA ligase n=1 Tax=Candidatus Magnetobacterium casense TaxID=1455061 RepID=A0ABS6RX83_9BACT|nr:glutamate--tRNA ligase [Candidatus Magnetobacterium casensis]MBF0607577.1 glutamate--tRNA ligase [Nitrospirota bacterium]MBV6341235.1 glutamate--tRNA ligase [Candidatus Magnetobacterium casensis]
MSYRDNTATLLESILDRPKEAELFKDVRVRFAPSPTGYLHIGGARTALFNYLFARRYGGTFILRIEDTDRGRSTDEYIEAILDGMRWLGLGWDDGPYRQTDRSELYNQYVRQLLDTGMAYYCYCSADELEEKRKRALASGKPPKYDGTCRDMKEPGGFIKPTVRFKMPLSGETVVDDLIKGRVVFENSILDDFIIMRSDDTPTYNFVVVVDDLEMAITHIIRGDDHLNNTPKQIHIYDAFGQKPPQFAHLPMILGADKARLSKRHGATSVQSYREMGYMPQALLNYLVRLGWSSGDQEVFSMEELTEKFSLDNVGKSSAVFNPEKLLWLNAEYIKGVDPEALIPLVEPFVAARGYDCGAFDPGWLSAAIKTLQERCRTLEELANSLKYYMAEDVEIDEKAGKKFINDASKAYLLAVRDAVIQLQDFRAAEIERLFLELISGFGVQLGKLAQPVRVAITGNTVSPGIFEVLELVGKERVVKRLDKAIAMIG